MAFSEFDLKTVRDRFNLVTSETQNLFASCPELEPSARLRELLGEWAPIAIGIRTEKARSEFIIAPILMEAVRLTAPNVRIFSGAPFDVDPEQGLNDACDYVLTRSQERYFVSNPVMTIIEAKKEDLIAGLGQCVAAMLAARIFNEREGEPTRTIHGAVTSGTNWRFLRLHEQTVFIDQPEYDLHQLGKILAILVHMVSGESTTQT